MQKNGKRATTIMESIDGYSEVYGKSTQDREDFEASNMGLIFLIRVNLSLSNVISQLTSDSHS